MNIRYSFLKPEESKKLKNFEDFGAYVSLILNCFLKKWGGVGGGGVPRIYVVQSRDKFSSLAGWLFS